MATAPAAELEGPQDRGEEDGPARAPGHAQEEVALGGRDADVAAVLVDHVDDLGDSDCGDGAGGAEGEESDLAV